jgi:hypothetical protein
MAYQFFEVWICAWLKCCVGFGAAPLHGASVSVGVALALMNPRRGAGPPPPERKSKSGKSKAAKGNTSGKSGKSGKSSGKKSKIEPKMLALPPPPPPPQNAVFVSPPPPPLAFNPDEGDVVTYSGRDGVQRVTVYKVHRNVPPGEEPFYDVLLPDGKHRDTTLSRLSPAC